jgi:hypothetical protein
MRIASCCRDRSGAVTVDRKAKRPAIKSVDRSMRAASTRSQRGQETLRLPHRVDASKVVRARWERAGEAAETIDRLGVVVCVGHVPVNGWARR